MRQADVPVVPGADAAVGEVGPALGLARELEDPVMVKAAAGGGAAPRAHAQGSRRPRSLSRWDRGAQGVRRPARVPREAHRALALAEMDGAAPIGEDLDLDVAWLLDELLEVHARVAERLERLVRRRGERGRQLLGRAHHPHAAAPATGRRLHHHRVAQLPPRPSAGPTSSTAASAPGTTGTSACRIRRRASVLSPIARIASEPAARSTPVRRARPPRRTPPAPPENRSPGAPHRRRRQRAAAISRSMSR